MRADAEPVFLTLDEVLAAHADLIERYGGVPGLRDLALLSSSLGAVRATFDGEYLHPSLFEMAGAYLFHVARNHPFVDGNKRTALMTALLFLWLNGHEAAAPDDDPASLVEGVAAGSVTKAQASAFLERHAVARTTQDPAR
jgi:death-on-curing protein